MDPKERSALMTEESAKSSNPDRVAIWAIVGAMIITLACIIACTVVSMTAILNMPWNTF
jgi:hypothetical protein